MTPQTELELNGNFLAHPFAELVAEISHAKLSGSLRLSNKDQKCILYFTHGRLPFAVSNARSSRLFDILLRRNRLTREDLASIPNFASDFDLTAYLQKTNFLTKSETDQLFIDQIEGIVVDILGWAEGEWSFDSLARIRDGLAFDVNTAKILVEYARCLSVDTVLGRFRSVEEAFERSESFGENVNLGSDELHVLTRFSDHSMKAGELAARAEISEAVAFKALYTLWLGGLVIRKDWNAAFSDFSVAKLRGAKLEIKREAKIATPVIVEPEVKITAQPNPKAIEPELDVAITLDEYLARVESAATHYDVLGIDPKAEQREVKLAYFMLAKLFHPDHFHKQDSQILTRVQHAFTELAKAHETLKNVDIRENYDFKMRKEIAEKEKERSSGGPPKNVEVQMQQAMENFDHGFNLLMQNQYEASLPFLARAAHFAPDVPRYRAFFGKALSADSTHRHKAEGEIQTAIKLEPTNPNYRIILVEFFIQMKLMKRAEGELNRMLATFPDNREARDLLESIRS